MTHILLTSSEERDVLFYLPHDICYMGKSRRYFSFLRLSSNQTTGLQLRDGVICDQIADRILQYSNNLKLNRCDVWTIDKSNTFFWHIKEHNENIISKKYKCRRIIVIINFYFWIYHLYFLLSLFFSEIFM